MPTPRTKHSLVVAHLSTMYVSATWDGSRTASRVKLATTANLLDQEDVDVFYVSNQTFKESSIFDEQLKKSLL